ncbi:hypothetical protein VTH8203_02077 [Vibrio thalassae]|uniref:Uncharacterized protein n=1 Tax=Vibrio thalassae TaxID=1243014 RepID=A0A240EJU9_9VIBR|nr:hypothetical protein VTH8203_02077 [Vibrio thalassae]
MRLLAYNQSGKQKPDVLSGFFLLGYSLSDLPWVLITS